MIEVLTFIIVNLIRHIESIIIVVVQILLFCIIYIYIPYIHNLFNYIFTQNNLLQGQNICVPMLNLIFYNSRCLYYPHYMQLPKVPELNRGDT